jgi:hypothetical protein
MEKLLTEYKNKTQINMYKSTSEVTEKGRKRKGRKILERSNHRE